jgi:hypothetical protein
MVLYYFNHGGYFFQNLVHCLTYHKNEEIVFLSHFSTQSPPAFKNLAKVYPNIKWITEKADIGKDVTTSQDDVKNTIVNYYENLFKEHNIKIKECSEIYIGFDDLPSFMIYLHIENISFTFFEISLNYHYNFVKYNLLWSEKILNNNVLSFWRTFPERGVTRSNVKILLYSGTQKIIDNQQEKNVFDFFEATLNLPTEDKNKILKDLYNLDEILSEFKDKDINLFLSNSYPLYRDTIGGQIHSPDTLEAYVLVSYFLDFYFQNILEIVVKLHPGCPWKGELACKSIGTNVLSQVLILAENFKVANTFSIGDTTAKLWFMEKGVPHHEIDRMKYAEIYSMLPQLDIATKAYSENISFFDKIYLHGINIDSYAEYCKFVLPDFKDNVSEKFDYNNKTFQICNAKKFKTSNYIQEDWSNLIHYVVHLHSENGCIFIINFDFPNFFNWTIFNSKAMNALGFHITIKKTQTAKEINAQLNDEHILVYCKNKELREKMLNSINGTVKELPNTGIKLKYLCEGLSKYTKPVNSYTAPYDTALALGVTFADYLVNLGHKEISIYIPSEEIETYRQVLYSLMFSKEICIKNFLSDKDYSIPLETAGDLKPHYFSQIMPTFLNANSADIKTDVLLYISEQNNQISNISKYKKVIYLNKNLLKDFEFFANYRGLELKMKDYPNPFIQINMTFNVYYSNKKVKNSNEIFLTENSIFNFDKLQAGYLSNKGNENYVQGVKDCLVYEGDIDAIFTEMRRIFPKTGIGKIIPNTNNYTENFRSDKFNNYIGGTRTTINMPDNAEHSIFIFGHSHATFLYAKDEDTIASQLQKLINEKLDGSYKIFSYGINASAQRIIVDDLIEYVLENFSKPGDVFIYLNEIRFPHTQNGYFLPLTEKIAKMNIQEPVLGDFSHFNMRGQKIAAEVIYDYIFNEQKIHEKD